MGPEDLKPEKKFARMIHRWKVGATSEKRNFWKFDELSAPLSVRSIISVWGLHDTSRLWGFELSRPKRELFTQILHDQISLEPAYQIPIWMQINSIVFSTRFQSPSQGSESFGGSSREFCLSLSRLSEFWVYWTWSPHRRAENNKVREARQAKIIGLSDWSFSPRVEFQWGRQSRIWHWFCQFYLAAEKSVELIRFGLFRNFFSLLAGGSQKIGEIDGGEREADKESINHVACLWHLLRLQDGER